MAEHRQWLGWVALGVLIAGGPARAANPRVTLQVREASVEQVLQQLSAASGVELQLYTNPGGAPARPAAGGQTASFNWGNVTLGKALRDVCAQFNLRPNLRPGGYVLYPSFQAPAAPNPKRVGLVEKSGVRFSVRSVTMNENRSLNFEGNQNFANANLNLHVVAELGEGDAEAVAGIENITAKDDLGNVIGNQTRSYNSGGSGYPDEWNGGVSMPAPPSKAKKLAWVEGDLMVYRSLKPVRAEIALPFKGKVARAQVGEVLFAVSRYQEGPQAVDDEDEGLPQIQAVPRAQGGPSMRVRVYVPNGTNLMARTGGWGMQPYLVGASGRVYSGNMNHSHSAGDGQMTYSDYTLTFNGMDERPVKIVWDLVQKSDPVKLLTFRMADIPLPEPPQFVPRAAAPQPGEAAVNEPEHPFYEKGGGTLVTRVQLLNRAGSEGSLQLGLSPKLGADWGPIRWTDVVVGLDGVARLENVKPGTYRVVRKYQPKAGDMLPAAAGARWLDERVEVTVAAGKEAGTPPLRFGVLPAAKPPVKK